MKTKHKKTNAKNALHDHTLKMNGPSLEKSLCDLAETALCSSGLGMIPDIATGATQAGSATAKLSSCFTLLQYLIVT